MIQVIRQNNVIARRERLDDGGNGGLTGCERQRGCATFQRSQGCFQRLTIGVAAAGINMIVGKLPSAARSNVVDRVIEGVTAPVPGSTARPA
jgi:hypothetical protein